jgi:hypothetical protein
MDIKNIEKFQFTKRENKLGIYLEQEYTEEQLKEISKQVDMLLQMRWIDSIYFFFLDDKSEEVYKQRENFLKLQKYSDYKRSYFEYSCEDENQLHDRISVIDDYIITDNPGKIRECFTMSVLQNLKMLYLCLNRTRISKDFPIYQSWKYETDRLDSIFEIFWKVLK